MIFTKPKYNAQQIGSLVINAEELQKLTNYAENNYYNNRFVDILSSLNDVVQNDLKYHGKSVEFSEILNIFLNKETVQEICQLSIIENGDINQHLKRIIGNNDISNDLNDFYKIIYHLDKIKEFKKIDSFKESLHELDTEEKIPEELKIILDDPRTELASFVMLDENNKISSLYGIEPKSGQVVFVKDIQPKLETHKILIEEFKLNSHLNQKNDYKTPIWNEIKLANIEKISIKVATVDENKLPKIMTMGVLYVTREDKRPEIEATVEELLKAAEKLNKWEGYHAMIVREPAMIEELYLNDKNDFISIHASAEQIIIGGNNETSLYYSQSQESFCHREQDGKFVSTKDIEWVIASTLQNEITTVKSNNHLKSILLDNIKGTVDFERLDFEKTGRKQIIFIDIQNTDEPVQYGTNALEISKAIQPNTNSKQDKAIINLNRKRVQINQHSEGAERD